MTVELGARGRWAAAAMLAVSAWLVAGCGGSSATRLHVLSITPAPAASDRLNATIGVGPVRVPEALDRLQLVSRDSAGTLVVSDTQRWAEPLGEALTRVLSEDLARRLGANSVARFPWRPSAAPRMQVPVDVLRFDAGPEAAVSLEARWRVLGADGSVLEPARRSRIEVPFTGGIEDLVRAHGEAAARLAADIEAGLREAQGR